MISRKNLEEKLVGLQTQLEQTQATVHAISGAVQLTKQLLEELTQIPEGSESGSVSPQSTGE